MEIFRVSFGLFFYLLDYITRHTLISGFQEKIKMSPGGNFSQTIKILNFQFLYYHPHM